MTKELTERKKQELRTMADAISESVVAVEMAARERKALNLETKKTADRAAQ